MGRGMTMIMPPEWAPQDWLWIGFPHLAEEWPGWLEPAQVQMAAFASAVADSGQQVRLLVRDEANEARARSLVSSKVTLERRVYGDVWLRDTGPLVVSDGAERTARRFGFNGWGGKYLMPGDQEIGAELARDAGLAVTHTPMILEGGAVDGDGTGLVATTEQCLLNPNRNPHLNREQIEQYLADHLAIDTVIWLPDGLFNDETDGHVDNFCCYVRPGEVLLAWTDDPQNPNYPRCQAAMNVLQNSTDAKGRPFVVHKMPIPGPLFATEEECAGVDPVDGTQERNPSVRLAGSYVNFLIVNGGIIAPKFDDPMDAEAEAILQRLFPAHRVVMVPGREILLGGGNIHCITQQQPAPQQR